MLKKEGLMIGSWVKIPELEYYNSDDDFDSGYTQIKRLGTYDLDTYSLKEISYEEVEPIPITSEILEKNGFIKDGYTNLSPDYYLSSKDFNIYVNLCSTCDKTAQIWCENRNTKHVASYEISRHALIDKTLYVHQLQQVLRSCKINKDIVL